MTPTTAADVRAALELRHPEAQGEWVVLHEPLAIDTLAIRCWTGGRGAERIGYEIKVSLSDWRRELARPEKRQRAIEITHRFFFAVPTHLALRVREELPDGCGLVRVDARAGGSFVATEVIRPKKREPRPLTVEEVAWLIRHRAQPPALRNALLERHNRNRELRQLRARLEDATRALAEVEMPRAVAGARLGFAGRDVGVEVARDAYRDGRGRIVVATRTRLGGEKTEELGVLLAAGYQLLPGAAA